MKIIFNPNSQKLLEGQRLRVVHGMLYVESAGARAKKCWIVRLFTRHQYSEKNIFRKMEQLFDTHSQVFIDNYISLANKAAAFQLRYNKLSACKKLFSAHHVVNINSLHTFISYAVNVVRANNQPIPTHPPKPTPQGPTFGSPAGPSNPPIHINFPPQPNPPPQGPTFGNPVGPVNPPVHINLPPSTPPVPLTPPRVDKAQLGAWEDDYDVNNPRWTETPTFESLGIENMCVSYEVFTERFGNHFDIHLQNKKITNNIKKITKVFEWLGCDTIQGCLNHNVIDRDSFNLYVKNNLKTALEKAAQDLND